MAGQLVGKSSTALASRNLSKMLNRIASAEKLEQQCRRARDPEGMFRAITQKIEEQAKYIVLRDAAMSVLKLERGGGGPGRGRKGPVAVRLLFPKGDRGLNPGPGRGHKGNQINKSKVRFPKGDPGQDVADR